MKIDLTGKEKGQVIQEIVNAVPKDMAENPRFSDLLSLHISNNEKITIFDNKVYISKEAISKYDKNDQICTIYETIIELNEKNKLVCSVLSGNIILKHNNLVTVSENDYITDFNYSIYSKEGLEEKEEIYSDKFSEKKNVITTPEKAIEMLNSTFINENGVFRPQIKYEQLSKPTVCVNGSYRSYSRSMNPNVIHISLGEGIGTPNQTFSGNQTYSGLDSLDIAVPSQQSYENKYPDKKEQEVVKTSDLIDSLERIKNGEILYPSQSEQMYDAYMNYIARNYGNIDNFLEYLNNLGLREKYDNALEQNRKR